MTSVIRGREGEIKQGIELAHYYEHIILLCALFVGNWRGLSLTVARAVCSRKRQAE